MDWVLSVFSNVSKDTPFLVRHSASWYYPNQLNFVTSLLLSISLNKDISIHKQSSFIGLIEWIESYNWWLAVCHSILILCLSLGVLCNICFDKLANQKWTSAALTCIKVSVAVVL